MFTLVHELAHIWLNADGLFNFGAYVTKLGSYREVLQSGCSRIPGGQKTKWSIDGKKQSTAQSKPFHAIAKLFKVSPVVVARRALDLRLIFTSRSSFSSTSRTAATWRKQKESQKKSKGGPNPYVVADSRLSHAFVNALVTSTREGRTLYRDAYSLIDMKGETYDRYADIVAKRMIDGATIATCLTPMSSFKRENDYYRFEICPGFWTLLERHDRVGSIEQIRGELISQGDRISEWNIVVARLVLQKDARQGCRRSISSDDDVGAIPASIHSSGEERFCVRCRWLARRVREGQRPRCGNARDVCTRCKSEREDPQCLRGILTSSGLTHSTCWLI